MMKKIKLKLTPRKIKFFSIVFCLLIVFVFSWLAFLAYSDYLEFSAQVEENSLRVSELARDVDNLSLFIADYQQEKADFKRLLFSDRDIATFLEEFSEFAKKAKISIIDMRVQRMHHVRPIGDKTRGAQQDEEVDLPLYSIPIMVVAEGGFEHIVNFFLFLDGYRQLLTISDVHIRNTAYPRLSCSFLLRLYSLKELSQAGAQNQ